MVMVMVTVTVMVMVMDTPREVLWFPVCETYFHERKSYSDLILRLKE